MKKTAIWVAAVLLLSCLLSGCQPKVISEQTVLLYFANQTMDGVNAESASLPDELTEQELLTECLNRLLSGPTSTDSRAVIPEGTTLISAKAGKKRATIDFSAEFMNTQSTVEELLCRYSIVRTVCELGIGIESVNLLVEGEPLVSKTTGEPVGALQPNTMIASLSEDNPSSEMLTLYFATDDMLLAQERRVVESKSTDSKEKQIVTELINGPQEDGHIKTLPSETKVMSVETKEGIAYVNFSRDFADKMNTMIEEQLKVYAVVNSLSELPQVEKVQILIEGAKVESLEYMMIQDPLERNDNLVKTE